MNDEKCVMSRSAGTLDLDDQEPREPLLLGPPVVGRGHVSRLTNVETWHSKLVRDIGYRRIFSPTSSVHKGVDIFEHLVGENIHRYLCP
jgi:hypothetical protein